ncbi:MAG TPA: hypothetical protein VMV49_16840 [Candidatus Deferrimicrobium sp.]|nr:hypothetical protein [Candidatus Deferrimicrobium sp.]
MPGGDQLVEEGTEAIIEDMGKGYRFRPLMQAVLMIIIVFVISFILFLTGFLDFKDQGDLTITTLILCWILAFLFPLIVKSKTHRIHQISMGIYFAAILALTGTILLAIFEGDSGIEKTSIPLLIAFLVGIGTQLFEHLNPELIKRTARIYLGIFASAVVFFICVWLYMENILPGFGIWLSIVITALFAYALLPEKPK